MSPFIHLNLYSCFSFTKLTPLMVWNYHFPPLKVLHHEALSNTWSFKDQPAGEGTGLAKDDGRHAIPVFLCVGHKVGRQVGRARIAYIYIYHCKVDIQKNKWHYSWKQQRNTWHQSHFEHLIEPKFDQTIFGDTIYILVGPFHEGSQIVLGHSSENPSSPG